jgi:2-amino-4-hydroxy-6-hydroxymethyldihydropteridine diphosphokinase
VPSGADAREPVVACLALGANLGDRAATLRAALAAIAASEGLDLLAVSAFYDTAPVGPPGQPRYLNAAATVATALGPRELLARLLGIERALGRERDGTRWSARTIDLDLILHGDSVLREGGEEGLEVPHPRFRERAFVLVPLAEIAPDARDPVTGERVESLLRACPGRAEVVRAEG